MPLTVDPNVVFIVLVLGLWMAVTSVYMPATGFPEVLAVLGLGTGALLLLSMPTNWLAVLLLIVGVAGFIAIPFLRRQQTTLALGGLALQGVGGFFLFNGLVVSPLIIVFALAIQFAYHQYVLMPLLRRIMDEPVISREDALIGMMGRVVHPLNPIGTVQVDAELWTATSTEEIEAGALIEVVNRQGLQLQVERLKDKRKPVEETLNGHSQLAVSDLPDEMQS